MRGLFFCLFPFSSSTFRLCYTEPDPGGRYNPRLPKTPRDWRGVPGLAK